MTGRKAGKAAPPEVKYYGLHACLELVKKRRDDTIRAYVTTAQLGKFKEFLQWCAKTRRAYHVVSSDELDKICQSVHHEGVCILTREAPFLTDKDFLTAYARRAIAIRSPLLFLADTANPHNVGAILRSAAHFGVQYVLGQAGTFPRLGGALTRISKGGAEHIQLILMTSPLTSLKQLIEQHHFTLISTSSHAKQSLHQFPWPEKAIIMLGHESSGVPEKLARLSKVELGIPGTDQVESLNVSVACGIILNEWYRGKHASPPS